MPLEYGFWEVGWRFVLSWIGDCNGMGVFRLLGSCMDLGLLTYHSFIRLKLKLKI
jgi:hypothetical protein